MKCSCCSRRIPCAAEVAEACVQPAHWSGDVDTLAEMVVKTAQPGDHIPGDEQRRFRRASTEIAGWAGEKACERNSVLNDYVVSQPRLAVLYGGIFAIERIPLAGETLKQYSKNICRSVLKKSRRISLK